MALNFSLDSLMEQSLLSTIPGGFTFLTAPVGLSDLLFLLSCLPSYSASSLAP